MKDMPHDLPLLAISLPGSLHAAQVLGIEGFLVKPVSREQLLDAITGLGRTIRNVLIVDDDLQLVELFGRMLQSARDVYQPIRAFGGVEALARLRQEPVDLVLLDLVMPEVSGLQVLEEMKADPALAQIPVIVISAQYPETTQAGGGLYLSLVRPQSASITETLNCLQALVGVLPMRGLPLSRAAPTSSPTLRAQPAS
jgi:CheY-like chemotaxis protein